MFSKSMTTWEIHCPPLQVSFWQLGVIARTSHWKTLLALLLHPEAQWQSIQGQSGWMRVCVLTACGSWWPSPVLLERHVASQQRISEPSNTPGESHDQPVQQRRGELSAATLETFGWRWKTIPLRATLPPLYSMWQTLIPPARMSAGLFCPLGGLCPEMVFLIVISLHVERTSERKRQKAKQDKYRAASWQLL